MGHSTWPDVEVTFTITSEKVIGVLISDNGLQFTSVEFVQFLWLHTKCMATMYTECSLPLSNGLAECFVQTLY